MKKFLTFVDVNNSFKMKAPTNPVTPVSRILSRFNLGFETWNERQKALRLISILQLKIIYLKTIR